MNKLITGIFIFTLAFVDIHAEGITKCVNPFIGTGAIKGGLSGNNYPGATVPFGMVQLSPDTREAPDWAQASGYDYNDNIIYGFSHTRLSGTGAADLIDILIMPTTSGRTSSVFSHEEEKACPGYYQVKLKDENINAELTTTQRTGIHRYQYPDDKDAEIMLDLNHSANKDSWGRRIINSQIRILNDHAVEGYRIITGWAKLRKIYFYMEFSSPILSSTLRDGGRMHDNTAVINGTNLHGCFCFGKLEGKPLNCKVALSSVSMENARQNMTQEAPHWNFDRYVAAADADWAQALGKIKVKGTDLQKEIFYTALYHTMIQPNTMSDVNAWQYFWYVPHNVKGLIELTGGAKAFEQKLDTFFTTHHRSGELNDNASGFVGQYAHGNEPSHHVAYLYNYAGQPWKAQKYISHILNNLYNNTSSGYAGNDDCGEMSAWYVFSAMGFYPVNPADSHYIIGAPAFDECTLKLAGNKEFRIQAIRKSPEDIYIQSVTLNGKKYNDYFITHQDIVNGGTMVFKMGKKPSNWGR